MNGVATKLKACSLLMALLLAAGAAWGQIRRSTLSTNNSLTISVKDPQGGDLQGVGLIRVELFRGDMPLEETYCDSRGQHTFYGLEDAIYAVRITLPGFQSQYHVVQLNGGVPRQLVAYLRHWNDAESKAAASDDATVSIRWLAAPEKAREEARRARKLRYRQDFKGAVKHLRRALKIAPDFVFAHNELGLCYWRLGKLDDARQAFETSIQLDADFLLPYLNLAEVWAQEKEFNRAGKILLQASKAQPDRGEPYYHMAKIQYATGHPERAEQACRLALARDHSKIPEVHILLANIYRRRGETAKVAAELEAYLAKAPQGEHAESARATLERIKPPQAESPPPPAKH